VHRKLRRAGVEADLNVYEGQSHAQYLFDPDAPETKEVFTDIESPPRPMPPRSAPSSIRRASCRLRLLLLEHVASFARTPA